MCTLGCIKGCIGPAKVKHDMFVLNKGKITWTENWSQSRETCRAYQIMNPRTENTDIIKSQVFQSYVLFRGCITALRRSETGFWYICFYQTTDASVVSSSICPLCFFFFPAGLSWRWRPAVSTMTASRLTPLASWKLQLRLRWASFRCHVLRRNYCHLKSPHGFVLAHL